MKEIITKRLSLTLRGDWTQPEKLAIIFKEEQIPERSPFSCWYDSQTDRTQLIIIFGGTETAQLRSQIAQIYGEHTL